MNIKTLIPILFFTVYAPSAVAAECVILLHGLARSSSSMEEIEQKLTSKGYVVANVDYGSREMTVEELANTAVQAGLDECEKEEASPINFVTHSLGGILVRQFYSLNAPSVVKRVVMIGPPNQGSEVVDNLKDVPGYELINGPAGMQLGTGNSDLPKSLGKVNFELGVIAGTRSINLILSTYLPNPDDGKVSVESTKVKGMCSFVALPVTHPFMMTNDKVIAEVMTFLASGTFAHEDAVNSCSTFSSFE